MCGPTRFFQSDFYFLRYSPITRRHKEYMGTQTPRQILHGLLLQKQKFTKNIEKATAILMIVLEFAYVN